MKTLPMLAAIVTVLGSPVTVLAQTKAEATAVKAVQIANARKANATLMRQYTWHSRTDLFIQGAVKDTRIELVNYGPTGQLQRTLLNDQRANMPIGFLMRAIAESEAQEVQTYLKGLQGLLEQYTLPTAGKVLDFMSQAQVTGADAAGLVSMTGHGVVVPGDTFTVWADPRSRQTRKVTVATTFQGGAVNLTATFRTLPSRLTYVDYAEVNAPAKQIVLHVQNFDFSRPEQPTTVTVNVPAAAPAAAPAPVSSSQAATVKKLKELKSLLSQGLITQAQYDADSQKLVNELVK
jgi:hypothetical protein